MLAKVFEEAGKVIIENEQYFPKGWVKRTNAAALAARDFTRRFPNKKNRNLNSVETFLQGLQITPLLKREPSLVKEEAG